MKPRSFLRAFAVLVSFFPAALFAGTWSDNFSRTTLGSEWRGNRNDFQITDGALSGQSAFPVAPSPFNLVETGTNWTDYSIQCDVNVVEPNLRVCTKGALVLRHNGAEAYVFALHVATSTIEVYRLSNGDMLFSKTAPLVFKKWYRLRAELNGPAMAFYVDGELVTTLHDAKSPSGAAGVAVQDAEVALFDNFSVTGPGVGGNGLNVGIAGEQIALQWPKAMGQVVLQSSDSLAPSGTWRAVDAVVASDGDRFTVTVPKTLAAQFYRLVPSP